MVAARFGRRTLPVTIALFVLASLGVAWAERIGDRDPSLMGTAFTAGLLAAVGLSAISGRRLGENTKALLASPWTWTAACLAPLLYAHVGGVRVGGTVVGVEIAGVFVQPTEVVFKLAFPPLLATGLVSYARIADAEPAPGAGRRLAALAPLGMGIAFAFAIPLLLLKEHGTLVLGGLLCACLIAVTGRGRDLIIPAVVVGILATGVAATEPRVQQRLSGFLLPACAQGHENEQRCTAATAAASSHVLGQGIASGRARDVPEAETDFPVSGFAEELGIPGVALLWTALALLVTFVFRELRANPQHSALAATVHGLLWAILLQAAWNHWMNLGLFLPVMGVPFPWLSFSGTTVFASTLGAAGAALLAWRASP
jgi:cell division protein FtsW (lipid II flippase)